MHDDFIKLRIYLQSASPIFRNGHLGERKSTVEEQKFESHMSKRSFFGKISIFHIFLSAFGF